MDSRLKSIESGNPEDQGKSQPQPGERSDNAGTIDHGVTDGLGHDVPLPVR